MRCQHRVLALGHSQEKSNCPFLLFPQEPADSTLRPRGKDPLLGPEGKQVGNWDLSTNEIPRTRGHTFQVFGTRTFTHTSASLSSSFDEQKQEKGNFQSFSFCQTWTDFCGIRASLLLLQGEFQRPIENRALNRLRKVIFVAIHSGQRAPLKPVSSILLL